MIADLQGLTLEQIRKRLDDANLIYYLTHRHELPPAAQPDPRLPVVIDKRIEQRWTVEEMDKVQGDD